MDYGGNSGDGCGFAPILEIFTDSEEWATAHAPGWFSGPVTVDEKMLSPAACQLKCQENDDCSGFAYQYDENGGNYYHECYVKKGYDTKFCNVEPFVMWEGQTWASNALNWHVASGLKSCMNSDYSVGYTFYDISASGTTVMDSDWVNPVNTWADDDGWVDVPLPFDFMWYGMPESTISVGTNGLITFGGAHLRNGASEPMPCMGLCDRGGNYGSHGDRFDWGVDGVIGVAWSDLNPCVAADEVCNGNGGGGKVMYQVFDDAAVVQWEKVENYVDPWAGGNELCDPAVTPAGENGDDTSWSPYWWTPTCPASSDPVLPTHTFQAILFPDGGVMLSYKDMPTVDPDHWFDQTQARGTGLSWSKMSIGYEDKTGSMGDQILYGEIPLSGTSYYIPPACSPQVAPEKPAAAAAVACPKPCIMQGMDYGGGIEPFSECGFAPIIEIITDSQVWYDNHVPGWYSGATTLDETMTSEYECQKRCAAAYTGGDDGCDFFSYEWEETDGGYYHECYLKTKYANYEHSENGDSGFSICFPDYVVWRNQPFGSPEDPNWHSASGPAMCDAAGGYSSDYSFYDISVSGTTIMDDQWQNPLNTWADDDGWYDVALKSAMYWYGEPNYSVSVGTNGLITFGAAHLRNGGSEPIPCGSAGMCGRNGHYGSHSSHADWGIDGVIAPYWNDINVCESGNVCGGNGGGGTVIYQVFDDSMVAQWEQVRFYVDPKSDFNDDPLCDPAVTPAGEDGDDTSWSPYWWTPTCPASQDPTTSTFQAILFADGSLQFNYKDMAVIDSEHWFHQPRGTGLSWSPASIGYEDTDGIRGDQISYDMIPASQSTYVVPAACVNDLTYDSLDMGGMPWRTSLAPDTCPEPCVKQGMDYGGRKTLESGFICDYAPILAIFTDNVDWAENHKPGWYSGPLTADETMTSPYECQTRCAATEGCIAFAYEWERTATDAGEFDSYYHECYLKSAFAAQKMPDGSTQPLTLDELDACMEYPYVDWSAAVDYNTGAGDVDWHSASGLGVCDPAGGYAIDYHYMDISGTGTVIQNDEWANSLNTWQDDDGFFDVPVAWGFLWYGQVENTVSLGTNGLITFGTKHLRNGGSEPLPCIDFCGRNEQYGSHGSRFEFGIDGIVAPYWNDLNPCVGGNVCGGNGGGGGVVYQVFADAMIAQWEQVRFYVDPKPDSGNDLCNPALTPAGEGTDESPYDNSWSPYWWTPACPASQDPTSSTFQAILYQDGGVMFSYKDMSVIDPNHESHQERGSGLSWSPASVGYEDRTGTLGDQISYDFIPLSGTSVYIPPACTGQVAPTEPVAADTCPAACIKQGEDFGGRPIVGSMCDGSASSSSSPAGVAACDMAPDFDLNGCGFGDIIKIYTDAPAWAAAHLSHISWYRGGAPCMGGTVQGDGATAGDACDAEDLVVDETMNSAFECQSRCASTVGCAGFSYEYESSCVDGRDPECTYAHECYIKMAYADDADTAEVDEAVVCNVYPYTVWSDADYASGAGDIQWHPASGPRSCTDSAYSIPYSWTDISRTGTTIQDADWKNEYTTWHDDDGYMDLQLSFSFPWFGMTESFISIGTNGLITFGGDGDDGTDHHHMPNGASEPVPCVDVCARNAGESYSGFLDPEAAADNVDGSLDGFEAFGIDGVLAPFWNDLNPCVDDNVCDGNGGGGAVLYKLFDDSAVVQWEQVRNYVAPPSNYNNDPRCDPEVTPAGEDSDDTSWSPYWWTPTCPASQDPTSFTFQAIIFADGGVRYNYKSMTPVDPGSDLTDSRGTGLSWSPVSIGYESQSGDRGDQIVYDAIPSSQTSYYIPPICSDESAVGPVFTLGETGGR